MNEIPFMSTDQIGELAKALAKAQGELDNATKSAANPFFKSKYADLAEVINTIKATLSKYELAYVQLPFSARDGYVGVETVLMHSSGQHIKSRLELPVSKADAQGYGSAITYARRYAIAAMVGLAQEDDDANSAVGHTKKPTKVDAKAAETKLRRCQTLEELKAVFTSLPPQVKEAVNHVKDEVKATLEQAA